MPLHKFKDFYPDNRESFGDQEILNIDSYSLYTQGDEKVGSVKDVLVDDNGNFRYLVVDTGPWIFGKKVLLPIGLARFDYDQERVYVDGLSREQVEGLPEYRDDMVVDEAYEGQIRESYRPMAGRRSDRQFLDRSYGSGTDYSAGMSTPAVGTSSSAEASAPVDTSASAPLTGAGTAPMTGSGVSQTDYTSGAGVTGAGTGSVMGSDVSQTDYTSRTSAYDYDRDPTLYGMSDRENHQRLRLYEERLIADKQRRKVGEVVVGKRVETETARTSIPVEKERVVIDRHQPTGENMAADVAPDFQEGEVARIDVYEETANVEKQAYVREEVDVHKEVTRETVDAEETVRREELDIDRSGNPNIDNRPL